ncbi:MAG: hypothetical protein F6J95_023560 [Leptolyngbya sp. SIO1E4]|nr:hypothetical protein [Leptolyngbya sp. SIO1E4]
MNYDTALEALESQAVAPDELQDDIDRLARILVALIRQLRPDLALLYVDHDEPMIADLLAEFGEDGLIEELVGQGPAILTVSRRKAPVFQPGDISAG